MRVLLINHFPLEGSGSGTYTKNIAMHLSEKHKILGLKNTFFLGNQKQDELRRLYPAGASTSESHQAEIWGDDQ